MEDRIAGLGWARRPSMRAYNEPVMTTHTLLSVDPPSPAPGPRSRFRRFTSPIVAGICAVAGCTALQTIGGDAAVSDLQLRLLVSNPSPGVGEQVFATCEVIAGDSTGLVFSFTPADARLVVDGQSGTATWIVDQTDIGIALSLTCRATSPDGSSAVSPAALIIATP